MVLGQEIEVGILEQLRKLGSWQEVEQDTSFPEDIRLELIVAELRHLRHLALQADGHTTPLGRPCHTPLAWRCVGRGRSADRRRPRLDKEHLLADELMLERLEEHIRSRSSDGLRHTLRRRSEVELQQNRGRRLRVLSVDIWRSRMVVAGLSISRVRRVAAPLGGLTYREA